MNLRDHPLTWGMFNCHNTRWGYDLHWGRVFWGVALIAPTGLAANMIALITPWLIILPIMLGMVGALTLPSAGRLHPLGRVPRYLPDDYGYTNENTLWKLARDYTRLPHEDKRQFPSNLLKLLADPDLTREQRESLKEEMKATFYRIKQRNAARRELVKRNVDIDSVVQYMRDQREGLAIETRTYKEYK